MRRTSPASRTSSTSCRSPTGGPPEEIEDRYDGQGYGQFKSDVAEAVIALLEPVRLRYEELSADPGELERLLRQGPSRPPRRPSRRSSAMYDRMGFVRP